MRETYQIKYRQPGQIFWRTLNNVKGDGVENRFRFFLQEDDTLTHISCDAEVRFSPHRAAVITHKMSKEIGQPVQRA
jgi:hypothetical protein